MNDLVLSNVLQVVTPPERLPLRGKELAKVEVFEDVHLGIKEGQISAVSKTPLESRHYIDASNCVILPGFVDCHTHIPFYGSRYEEFLMRTQGKSYMEIMQAGGGILSTVEAVRAARIEDLLSFNNRLLGEMLSRGVTTVEGKSGYGLDKDTELKQLKALRVLDEIQNVDVIPTFLGAHAIPSGFTNPREYLEYVISILDDVREYTDTVDIFCEDKVFGIEDTEYFLKAATARGFKVRLHADELASLGGSKLAARYGALSADHLIAADEDSLKTLANSETAAVLMPGTSFFLRESYAKGRQLLDNGAIVALASDLNPGSCNIYDPFMVIHLAVVNCGITIEEAINAYTANAAYVLGLEENKGLIREGYTADLVLLDLRHYREIPYRFSHDIVRMVIKDGEVVLGDL